ncbi:putative NAD(P)-binding domain-containing protein [Medicago truncatula]|uniref:Putative NAD(P)-binding domain-containing protein n=1 Tax=Medicago truncatula TaxID=3880 RepID=A0A396I7U8_MEDTR|nr:putative NAD(P)-binding domain-containing protein [Medicago truncatula]
MNIRDEGKTQLIDPAVKGTLNVLKSCAKSPSVKRVVITSIASVVYNGRPRTPEVVVDETWFSNPDLLWEQKLDAGSETYRTAAFRWINVKDVANAHINAYEDASASGRYCLAERVMHFSELVNILRCMYPTLKFQTSKFFFSSNSLVARIHLLR